MNIGFSFLYSYHPTPNTMTSDTTTAPVTQISTYQTVRIAIWVLLFGLGFASIVLSTQNTSCDITDAIGFNISNYLLGFGAWQIAMTIMPMLLIFTVAGLSALCQSYTFMFCNILFIIVFTVSLVFTGFVIFCLGSVVLFRSNMNCVHQGTPMAVFALVTWMISIGSLLMALTSIKLEMRCSETNTKMNINFYW